MVFLIVFILSKRRLPKLESGTRSENLWKGGTIRGKSSPVRAACPWISPSCLPARIPDQPETHQRLDSHYRHHPGVQDSQIQQAPLQIVLSEGPSLRLNERPCETRPSSHLDSALSWKARSRTSRNTVFSSTWGESTASSTYGHVLGRVRAPSGALQGRR